MQILKRDHIQNPLLNQVDVTLVIFNIDLHLIIKGFLDF